MSELLLTMWNEHLTLIGLNNSRVEYLSVCDWEESCGNV